MTSSVETLKATNTYACITVNGPDKTPSLICANSDRNSVPLLIPRHFVRRFPAERKKELNSLLFVHA